MISLLLNLLVVFSSVTTLFFLLIIGGILFMYRKENKSIRLLLVIIGVFIVFVSNNTFYEYLFLFKGILSLPSLNSWMFTLVTPLFYLYYYFRATSRYPDRKRWVLHLLTPMSLLLFYVVCSYESSRPDHFVCEWPQFDGEGNWWIIFRLACYVLFIAQTGVYLYYLIRNKWVLGTGVSARIIYKNILYSVFLGLIALVTMLTPYPIIRILYNISIIVLFCSIIRDRYVYRVFLIFWLNTEWLIPIRKYFFTSLLWLPERDILSDKKLPYSLSNHRDMFDYIEQRIQVLMTEKALYHDPKLNMRKFAREIPTNETYLRWFLQEHYQQGFSDFVLKYRLDEAEQFILGGNTSMQEISELVGFYSVSSFYHSFKNKHQIPPAQWRKINIAENDTNL